MAAQKFDFLFVADSGPGETDSKGLIVPRYGKNPENHVSVSLTWDALAELLLYTKTHYEAWLASWYLSQTRSNRKPQPQQAEKAPPVQHPPTVAPQLQFTFPEYSAASLF